MFEVMMAQATELPSLSPLFDILLNNGALGIGLGFMIWIFLKRDKDLQASWNERLADAKSFATIVKDHTSALTASNIAQDERNRAVEVSARAAEKSAIIIEQLSKEISAMKEELRLLKDREDKMRK